MRAFRWSCLFLALSAGCIVPIEDVSTKDGGSGSGQGGSGPGGTAGTGGVAGSAGTTGGGGNANGGSGGSSANGGTGGGAASGGTGGATGGTGGGTGGIGPCGVGMVSVNVKAADYCIDQYEVTQGEYDKFLSGGKPLQTDPCTSNAFEAPNCDWTPDTAPSRPVVCVDWCDARAYCQQLGKRLCGRIGGGTLDTGSVGDAAQDEWYAACSHEGSLIYPYGALYDASKCNGIDAPTVSPVAVGSFVQCLGGYPSLYDMSGNVKEWEEACTASDCYVRGGSYLALPQGLACKTGAELTVRTALSKEIGFRCCK